MTTVLKNAKIGDIPNDFRLIDKFIFDLEYVQIFSHDD
jgi:hypothetical protein